MDERLEGERSRVLGLREMTTAEAHPAGEWLSRWKMAKEDDEVKKAEQNQKKNCKKKQKATRRDSPMEGQESAQTGDDAAAESKGDTEDVGRSEDLPEINLCSRR